MKFANVGRSDLRVSKIALGTMTFGSGDGFAGLRPLVDAELAPRLVSMAVERGVTTFDSAGRYQDGEAETILGQAIAPYRDRVVISTKDPVLPPGAGGPVAHRSEPTSKRVSAGSVSTPSTCIRWALHSLSRDWTE